MDEIGKTDDADRIRQLVIYLIRNKDFKLELDLMGTCPINRDKLPAWKNKLYVDARSKPDG